MSYRITLTESDNFPERIFFNGRRRATFLLSMIVYCWHQKKMFGTNLQICICHLRMIHIAVSSFWKGAFSNGRLFSNTYAIVAFINLCAFSEDKYISVVMLYRYVP